MRQFGGDYAGDLVLVPVAGDVLLREADDDFAAVGGDFEPGRGCAHLLGEGAVGGPSPLPPVLPAGQPADGPPDQVAEAGGQQESQRDPGEEGARISPA